MAHEWAETLVKDDWVKGMMVGIVDGNGVAHLPFGDSGTESVLSSDTVFEIGSVTKVFTGILLAEAVRRNLVTLETPVRELLPESVKVPKHEAREITLVDLATHTSGLPAMPDNFKSADANNPYADYTVEQLYAFLSAHELARAPGATHAYSNIGAGLLGHALALKAGKSYEELVKEWILQPLGMDNTFITLSDAQRKRFAQGHDSSGKTVSHWDIPTLAGAGALRSTLPDMLTFARANFPSSKTPLSESLAFSHKIRHSFDEHRGIGLFWLTGTETSVVGHNGQTGGFHSYVAVDKKNEYAVVVLANTASMHVDAYAQAVLQTLRGKPATFELPKTISLPAHRLDALVGTYELAPTFAITITRDGDRLLAQATGQPAFPIYPSSETKFYYRVVDAQLTFELGADGQATKLTLHQGGMNMPAPRKVTKTE
jgi:CubicO group peptidase (beta-lactamase class C family)